MVIYRPNCETLDEAMAKAIEFEDIDEMKQYIYNRWNSRYEYFSIEDIVVSEDIRPDERVNWMDARSVCIKRFGDVDYMLKYGCPQYIGTCATKYNCVDKIQENKLINKNGVIDNMKKFDVEKETKKVIEFIRDYYRKNNLGGVILGISGGKDSGVVAGLFVEALGEENVIGVTLPCHSKEDAKEDAKLVSDYYGFELINFELTEVFDIFKKEITVLGNFTEEEVKNSDINLKPRLRMATLYYLAALYSSVRGKTYLVSGTSNKCELYVGYFTKGGDSVHDISPIADFTVDEVIQIGEYLKVPEKVLYKTPDDGLSNQTDEDKLGVKYSEIAAYMEDENSVPLNVAKRIRKLHQGNQHKFNIPTYRRNG